VNGTPVRHYTYRHSAREAEVRAMLEQIRTDREADRLLADSFDEPDEPAPRGIGRGQRPVWQMRECGTEAAYRRHLRKKEKPCEACREANRLGHHERTAGRRAS
jgi:hypothetical protein